jgi:choice-of-anchor B domain-containing protein
MKKLRFLSTFLAVAGLLLPAATFPHGDTEKPLFVADNGNDQGECTDPADPCATINYALTRAGKGGQIRVTEGTYSIEHTEDLFHVVSGVVEVQGGYRKAGKAKMLATGPSILTGVPFEFRDKLEGRGFKVVADIKGIDSNKVQLTNDMLQLHRQLKSSIPFTPCVGGSAAGLPCEQIDLLSHVGLADISGVPSVGNDVWGFVDLNSGREYAIIGFNTGTAVFDVTDATNPREVGFVAGQNAVWRDIKVFQIFNASTGRWNAYAYVTTDGSTDGLFVIDMTGLPQAIRRMSYASDMTSAHNVYAMNTDYGTGLSVTGEAPTLVVAGSSNANGNYRSYSLANPASPAFVPGGMGNGYMHDASSLLITDARKDTQCVNASTYCEVLLDFNENSFEIWDVTNSTNPVQLSNTPYVNFGYVHSGWWSEDRQFVFVHDELDEQRFALPTTLRVFSIANLAQPSHVGTWSGPTNAIDHNGFVRGNRYYMSNYTRGLTILDITDPANPAAIGRLDTYPMSDSTMFNGAWGAYPFFHSGNVAISDIDSGLYMAADMTRSVPQGSLAFAGNSAGATEGQQGQLLVQRTGGASGAVSVTYEIVHATATGNDYVLAGGVLNWANGDAAGKPVNITAQNDGVAEGLERMLVRLINPTGGATLGNQSTAHFFISDPGSASTIVLLESAIETTESGFGTLIGVVQRHGSAAGAVSVNYSMSSGNAVSGTDFEGNTTGTVNWADGDATPKNLEFIVMDDGVTESDEFFNISLENAVGASIIGATVLNATIRDGNGTPLPVPPPPPPTSSGGGGGSIDWLSLAALLGVAMRRRRFSRTGAV